MIYPFTPSTTIRVVEHQIFSEAGVFFSVSWSGPWTSALSVEPLPASAKSQFFPSLLMQCDASLLVPFLFSLRNFRQKESLLCNTRLQTSNIPSPGLFFSFTSLEIPKISSYRQYFWRKMSKVINFKLAFRHLKNVVMVMHLYAATSTAADLAIEALVKISKALAVFASTAFCFLQSFFTSWFCHGRQRCLNSKNRNSRKRILLDQSFIDGNWSVLSRLFERFCWKSVRWAWCVGVSFTMLCALRAASTQGARSLSLRGLQWKCGGLLTRATQQPVLGRRHASDYQQIHPSVPFGHLVYAGSLSRSVRVVKFCSLSSSALYTALVPFLLQGDWASSLDPLPRAVLALFPGLFTYTMTFYVHMLTSCYVHKIYYFEPERVITVEMRSIIGKKINFRFYVDDLQAPISLGKAFCQFSARGRNLFIRLDHVEDPALFQEMLSKV